jgi:hypothetical protein
MFMKMILYHRRTESRLGVSGQLRALNARGSGGFPAVQILKRSNIGRAAGHGANALRSGAGGS